jgi:hypothetical protein
VSNITLRRAEAEQIRAALVSGEKLFAALTALDAALAEPKETFAESLFRRSWEAHRAERAEPVEHRCHADIDDLSGPDSCVLDGGNPDDCMYARRFGKNAREHCGEWKPFIRKEDKT